MEETSEPDAEFLQIKELLEKTIYIYRGQRRKSGLQKAWEMLYAIGAEHQRTVEEYAALHQDCLARIGRLRHEVESLKVENQKLKSKPRVEPVLDLPKFIFQQRVNQEKDQLAELMAKNDRLVAKNSQLTMTLAEKCWETAQNGFKN